MPEELRPEEQVGPLNSVEIMLIHGEHDRHNSEVKRLEEVYRNLERSLAQTRRELQSLKDRQAAILREIVRTRGKDAGRLRLCVLSRNADSTTWIVAKPQES